MRQVEKTLQFVDFEDWLAYLRQGLSAVGYFHCLVFAASCCERQIGNYCAFARDTLWGKPESLREALDFIWHACSLTQQVNREQAVRWMTIAEELAPDTEHFNSRFTSAAMDAANSIAETLNYAIDKEVGHLVTVCSLNRDTIDLFIQHRDELDYSDPTFERRIATDKLTVTELYKQQSDYMLLKSTKTLTDEFVKKFRANATDSGKSNLGMQ